MRLCVQVVKAKVLNCDLAKEKLLLSFKAVAGGDTEAPPKPQFDFEIGKVRGRIFLSLAHISLFFPPVASTHSPHNEDIFLFNLESL